LDELLDSNTHEGRGESINHLHDSPGKPSAKLLAQILAQLRLPIIFAKQYLYSIIKGPLVVILNLSSAEPADESSRYFIASILLFRKHTNKAGNSRRFSQG
jgi:hypothetical protein